MRIGVYDVSGEIGRGGMGLVLRAQAPDGRPVALKLLHRLEAEPLARFERERRLLGGLGALEGFVPLLDAGTAPSGQPYLVMPFMSGGTLRRRLDEGPMPVAAVVSLGGALARAVGRAHERGLVHRDLNPENVLYD